MTIFDAIQNGIASVGNPFNQFHVVGSNKAARTNVERTRRTLTSLFVSDYIASEHLFLDSAPYLDDATRDAIPA